MVRNLVDDLLAMWNVTLNLPENLDLVPLNKSDKVINIAFVNDLCCYSLVFCLIH